MRSIGLRACMGVILLCWYKKGALDEKDLHT